jgi:hypothetical protein
MSLRTSTWQRGFPCTRCSNQSRHYLTARKVLSDKISSEYVAKHLSLLAILVLNPGMALAQSDSILYLIGRVAMEDEAPVPKDFYVQLVCSNRVIKQVNPSPTGTFAFDLGSAKPTPGHLDASGTETQGGLRGGFMRDLYGTRGFLVIGSDWGRTTVTPLE